MLRVVAQTVQESLRLQHSGADLVDGGKQWESTTKRADLFSSPSSRRGTFAQNTHLSSMPLLFSIKFTSSAVIGPCSFCPLSISFSSSTIVLPVFTNASDTLRLRPPVLSGKGVCTLVSSHHSTTPQSKTPKFTVTRSDEISNAAALEERRQLAARVEHIHELDHLHQT